MSSCDIALDGMRGRHCKARLAQGRVIKSFPPHAFLCHRVMGGVVCNDNERCLAPRLSVPSHDGKGRFRQKRLAPYGYDIAWRQGPGLKGLLLDTHFYENVSPHTCLSGGTAVVGLD